MQGSYSKEPNLNTEKYIVIRTLHAGMLSLNDFLNNKPRSTTTCASPHRQTHLDTNFDTFLLHLTISRQRVRIMRNPSAQRVARLPVELDEP